MKKPYKILLIAFVLVVIGFVMDSLVTIVPFSSSEQVRDVTIEPNSKYSFQINSKGEREISGVFLSTPSDIQISMKVLNPDQSILWESNSKFDPPDEQYILPEFLNPNPKGTLDVIITNLGDQKVIVSGGMHDVPKPLRDENDAKGVIDVYGDFLAYSIISGLLMVSGIILGVFGALLLFKERKNLLN